MRPHLLECLENKGITKFPHEARSNLAGVILTTKTAAIHCLCQKASKKREKKQDAQRVDCSVRKQAKRERRNKMHNVWTVVITRNA